MNSFDDLTVKEVSQELDVSYTTVLNMIKRKELKAIKRGGCWYVTKDELQRFEKEGNHPDSMKEDLDDCSD